MVFFPKVGNYGLFQIWDLSTPSERAPSKLSEKHNIAKFGALELELQSRFQSGVYFGPIV